MCGQDLDVKGREKAEFIRGEKLMNRKYLLIFAVTGLMIGLITGCGNETDATATQGDSFVEETFQWETEGVMPQAADLDAMAISHEIDDYIEHFTGLYTSNTLGDTASAMIIEEQNFTSDNDNGASLTVYSDSSGKRL